MLFKFVSSARIDGNYEQPTCVFVKNNWDDFGFKTSFEATLYGVGSKEVEIGNVRIAKRGMKPGWVDVPTQTTSLGDEYYSLGNDEEYYRVVATLPKGVKEEYLKGVRDVVFERELLKTFDDEEAMSASLLRFASIKDVVGKYPLILSGQFVGQELGFSFTTSTGFNTALTLTFGVSSNSRPPTNIHVLIGRNGVGKTRLLAGMTAALSAGEDSGIGMRGEFQFFSSEGAVSSNGEEIEFLNVVAVSFSVFDRFNPLDVRRAQSTGTIPYHYIGIKKEPNSSSYNQKHGSFSTKTPDEFTEEFEYSIMNVFSNEATRAIWRETFSILSSDPQIGDLRLTDRIEDSEQERQKLRMELVDLFDKMSSGHKIVFLTMAQLIEHVRDRTLVIFDEPETHLHPPLLGSLMRALSVLFRRKNAIAIIATHSPVVLQEVPSRCVQIISKSGDLIVVKRPDEETFAENVSVLTRRVFNLELSNSGFYNLLKEEVKDSSADNVERKFGDQIGGEGRALLRSFNRGN